MTLRQVTQRRLLLSTSQSGRNLPSGCPIRIHAAGAHPDVDSDYRPCDKWRTIPAIERLEKDHAKLVMINPQAWSCWAVWLSEILSRARPAVTAGGD